MDPRHLFFDDRFKDICVYCGARPNTVDHVPSKVFLDEPYPENLPVVPCCEECNQSFSTDEEYTACAIECVIVGSVKSELHRRVKISRILHEKPNLANRIATCCFQQEDGSLIWKLELDRIRSTLLKLARGHAAYELAEPRFDELSSFWVYPLAALKAEQRNRFESASDDDGCLSGYPEIGSRAFRSLVVVENSVFKLDTWQDIQEDRYRYMADARGDIVVRIVIGEYLACEAIW